MSPMEAQLIKKNPGRSNDPGFKFDWCGVQDSNL